MNQLKIKVLISLFVLSGLSLFAQIDDREKFGEALFLMQENRFASAEPLLREVYANDKENANINYCLGYTIFQSFTQKDKKQALPFLLLASKKADPNYSYSDPREKKAPVDVWYYLGKAQHNDYQFVEAIESFKKFKTYVTKKHPLYIEIDKSIKMSTYAQEATMNPVNIKTTNLGNRLNGFYPDYSPVVRIDESAVYFTSRRLREDSSNYNVYDPIDGMMFEDIYVSLKEEDGTWGEPYPLNINTGGHEATVNLSIDGRTLYLYKDISGNGQLFESKLEDDSMGYETWSEPQLLGSDINTKAYESHVTVTPDGKRLYFISNREGGLGGKDIYFCNRLPMGTWALAQNAGSILNSKYNEDGVFMHPDGKTLYFSSDGHESMGGYDIMYSTLTDTGWTDPTNMGYPINSVDDDVFFVTTPDGKRAYFSSFKEDGYGEKDVYMLELIDAEEIALTLYRGEFTFADRYVPPTGAQVTITNNTSAELVGIYNPRQRDGQFSAILAPNQSYHLVYEADGYETYEEDIYVSSAGNYQEIYKDIKLRPVRVGEGLGKIEPAGLVTANIKGGLMKDGVPLEGMRIRLLDKNEGLLKETVSDKIGEFQYLKLNPAEVYLIRVYDAKENPLVGLDVAVENDQGEVLPFEQLDDSTYIFIPSIQPYQFYGIGKVKMLAGTVKKEGKPIQGLKVRLENDQQVVIDSKETDEFGQFNFEKLKLDEQYRIVFEGIFPDDPEILITNDLGQKLRFVKERDGIYKYMPLDAIDNTMSKVLLSDIAGSVTSKGNAIANLQVLLLAGDQSTIDSTTTDNAGKFNFQGLDLTKRYFIKFQGDYPADAELAMSNKGAGSLIFRKIQEGLYQYDPIFVRLENSGSQVLGKEIVDNFNELNQKKLKLDQYYQVIYEGNFPELNTITLTNEKGEKFDFLKYDDGKYQYVPEIKDNNYLLLTDDSGTFIAYTRVRLENANRRILERVVTDIKGRFKFSKLPADETLWVVVENEEFDIPFIKVQDKAENSLVFKRDSPQNYKYIPSIESLEKNGLKSYTIDVRDELDYKETYPRPEELKDVVAYFQKYFTYNMKDINESNKEFVSFIQDIADLVKERGDAKIIITSSASKVPTRTWKTNSILTKKRAYDTKALLERVFAKQGIKPEQYNFVDLNTLITGPEYKGDYISNKSTYEKYQYVRIFVK